MPKKESKEKKYSLPEYRFLLNANISRKILPDLHRLSNFDFKHISEISKDNLTDPEIIEIAKKQHRIIITHDLDYGEIYYLKERGYIGVIMLRLNDQTSESVANKLFSFLSSPKFEKTHLYHSLVIISDEKIRIFSPD